MQWLHNRIFTECTYFFYFKLGIYGLDQVQSHLNIAASFAEQILLSIKTVMAYGGKEKEAKRLIIP